MIRQGEDDIRSAVSQRDVDPSSAILTSQQLRVAIVSDAIAGRNGVGTYYPDLIEHLEPSVDSIQLLGPTDPRDRSLEAAWLPMPGDLSQRVVWPRRKELYRRLDEQDPNLIVIPAIGAFSYFAMRYAERKKIPFVLVNHTNFDQLLSLYWPDFISKPLGYVLSRVYAMGMRRAAAVAAMNSESLDQARDLGARMVRVMGTPISPEFIQKPVESRVTEIKRVTFVGRLAAEKGLDHLLEAAKTLRDVEFRIAGDGPRRSRVERTAAQHSNVRYLGWLSRENVLREMDETDVLVLPSSVETFGTVALEALARRRYVLVRRQCGISKWPAFAEGLFYIEADEPVAAAITRMRDQSVEQRDSVGRVGWAAVNSFNEYTNRVWLRFMTDAAGLSEAEVGGTDAAKAATV
ncbi:MAG: glycosyltransferase [Planctomycetota bacterium]